MVKCTICLPWLQDASWVVRRRLPWLGPQGVDELLNFEVYWLVRSVTPSHDSGHEAPAEVLPHCPACCMSDSKTTSCLLYCWSVFTCEYHTFPVGLAKLRPVILSRCLPGSAFLRVSSIQHLYLYSMGAIGVLCWEHWLTSSILGNVHPLWLGESLLLDINILL